MPGDQKSALLGQLLQVTGGMQLPVAWQVLRSMQHGHEGDACKSSCQAEPIGEHVGAPMAADRVWRPADDEPVREKDTASHRTQSVQSAVSDTHMEGADAHLALRGDPAELWQLGVLRPSCVMQQAPCPASPARKACSPDATVRDVMCPLQRLLMNTLSTCGRSGRVGAERRAAP